MFLALREMRRAIARFALLMGSIALLVLLILFQQTLQNGLLTSFVGAIENQDAPVLVYSVDGRRNLQGSIITPDLEQQISQVESVARAGRIGQGTFSVDTSEGLTSISMIGYSEVGLGAPTTLVDGRLPEATAEAVALDSSADSGLGIGDVLTVEPGGYQIEVVGLAERIGLQASATVFTTYDTYVETALSANPDATGALPAVIAVEPVDGVSDEALASDVNAAVPDADALTSAAAAAETPGVAQVRQSFQLIFLLYGLVVPLVTGLFFLIITLQKANALTLLRALGASGASLVRALLAQVVLVLIGGIALGVALYTPLSTLRLGDIPLSFQTGAVVFWSVVLLVLGVLSSLASARRVLSIDPIEATTGAGVGR